MFLETQTTPDIRGCSFAFARDQRLLRPADFLAMKEATFRASVDSLTLVVRKRDDFAHARLGLVAGRKNGDAVRRNRFKRLVREVFRTEVAEAAQSCDILAISKGSLPRTLTKNEVRRQLEIAWKRYERHIEKQKQSPADESNLRRGL